MWIWNGCGVFWIWNGWGIFCIGNGWGIFWIRNGCGVFWIGNVQHRWQVPLLRQDMLAFCKHLSSMVQCFTSAWHPSHVQRFRITVLLHIMWDPLPRDLRLGSQFLVSWWACLKPSVDTGTKIVCHPHPPSK